MAKYKDQAIIGHFGLGFYSSFMVADKVEITQIEKYIREKRREGLKGFGLMHVLLAAYVRTVAQMPGINRFLSGQKIYARDENIEVNLTIDREQPEWSGHVGFVPNYVKELGFTTDKTVVMCGPPIMIKFTLAGLMELGFAREQVYTTMELKMKCALGKCGRCNIGNKYVCKDGPVFRFDQLDELPDEY